jgi:uncharacterized protein with LGFP repeats
LIDAFARASGAQRRLVSALAATGIALAATGIALAGAVIAPVAAHAAEGGSDHCGVPVHGAIEHKYLQFGAQRGPLGCPTKLDAAAPGGGRWQGFHGGVIFWHPAANIQAHVVEGAILKKWRQSGEVPGFGYPVTDEIVTRDGTGRYNRFERASIYWTRQTGAHPVTGRILKAWAATGYERGCLGYPAADEADTAGGDGRHQAFQHGIMGWTASGAMQATC